MMRFKANHAIRIDMSKRLISLPLIAAVLSACGTASTSSGPMGVGPETWRIAARDGMKGAAGGQRMALSEANVHCQGMSRQILVTGTRELDPPYGSYEVTYRCLKDGDIDLVRPNLQRAPDTVIQVK
jgi:hypothetical protein